METQVFERELKEKTRLAEEALRAHLPAEEGLQRKLIEAMNYSLLAGGKRLRPILMKETYEMCGGEGDPDALRAFMAAIEMIHTYSLVHDDLPAMDNDRYRRGRETTWYVYGETMGILAGDGLLNYAFETAAGALTRCCREGGISETERAVRLDRIAGALSVLSRKAGAYGMIGGQAVDVMDSADQAADVADPAGEAADIVDSAGQAVDAMNPVDPAEAVSTEKKAPESPAQERLLFIHEHKTAALVQAAMMAGAILAGASPEEVGRIEKCAYNVGIAFQIQDDILDVVGDSRELGKSTGSDAENNKQTYVALKGLERAKADVERLSKEAVDILDGFYGEHAFLKELILALIHRTR